MILRQPTPPRETGVGARRLYALSCWLVLIIGLPLFFWPHETEHNFAWTVRPAVTAAGLGAAYFASFVVVFIARREEQWARARIGLPFAFAFAWLMLGVTLIHLDRFHLGGAFRPTARAMAWTWLAVYISVPLLQVVVLVQQWRRPGAHSPREAPIGALYRGVAALAGVALAGLGIALVVFPGDVAKAVWPWPLTPLNARAVGAWLLAWGVVAVQVAWEGDWLRARAGHAGLAALGALQLTVLLRHADMVTTAWGFALGAAALMSMGLLGVLRSLQAGPPPVYRYVDHWRVEAAIEEVAEILRDGVSFPRWWGAVYRDVQVVQRGDARRIGEVGRVRAQGFLPYQVEFSARVTDERFPHGFSLEADGELSGQGEWVIQAQGPWVDVAYHWQVSGNKPLWRYSSFALRPLYEANHRWTMRRGEEGLRLELARRRAATPEERAAIPPAQGPVTGAGDVLRALLEVFGLRGRSFALRVEHSVVIARPVDQVFAYVAQVQNDLAWQPQIREITMTSTGAIGVGSTFREVRRTLGRTLVWHMRVTVFQPDRHLCIESLQGSLPYRGCREFAAVAGGTRVTETGEVQLPRYLRPASGLIARAARAPVVQAYERLKARLENGAPARAQGDSAIA